MILKEIVLKIGYWLDKKSEKKANDSIENLLKGAKSFAKGFATLKIAKELIKIADGYTQIANKLRYATQGAEDLAAAQNKITATATETKSTYQDIAGVAATMLNSRNALVPDLDTANEYTEMIVKAFRAAGESNEQAIANARSVAQSFTTGVLNGGVVQDAMVNAPEIVDYLADYFGTSAQGVKARANYIRVEDFIKALKANKEGIEKSFGQLDNTLGDVKNVIKNDLGDMISDAVGEGGNTADGLMNMWNDAKPLVEGIISGLGAIIPPLTNIANEFVGKNFKTIGDGIKAIGDRWETWKKWWNGEITDEEWKQKKYEYENQDFEMYENMSWINPAKWLYKLGIIGHEGGTYNPDLYKAKGDVIEPNNPHAVIVGDNKQEREIISPLSTMRRAVSEAMMNMRGNLAAVNGAKVTQYFTITNTFHGGAESAQTQGAAVMTKVERDIISDLADVMQMI